MIDFKSMFIEDKEVIEFLRQKMMLKDVCQQLMAQKIINNAATKYQIIVTPEEVQRECDLLRHQRRLEKVEDTLAWLKEEMLTPEDWEESIINHLKARKLASYLFAEEVEKYFAQNRLDFDRFVIYQVVVPFEPLAKEIFYQIEEEEISFYEAAHIYDIDEKRRDLCGYEGLVHRWSLPPDVSSLIFKTPLALGKVLGPIKTHQGYHLFMIEKYLQAELNSQKQDEIIHKFFEEWLNNEINNLICNLAS